MTSTSTNRTNLQSSLMALALLVAVVGGQEAPVAEVDGGLVLGKVASRYPTVNQFLGIPFAAPPVGDLRWRSPQPAQPWQDALNATRKSTGCPSFNIGISIGDEDCLYLDVYAPHNATGSTPVMVWFYGGGWSLGRTQQYPGGVRLASEYRDTVIVMMNYRLGPFGFLALDELVAEDEDASTGNYGLQDQRFALEWVQRNIHAFGGDADKVTIFGESAGAFSVCWHLASPRSAGLFRAAIGQSATCDDLSFFRPLPDAVAFSNNYMRRPLLGCALRQGANFVQCLRELSQRDVQPSLLAELALPIGEPRSAWYPAMAWGAAIDGSPAGLLDRPTNLFDQGHFNRVPTLWGTNDREAHLFVPAIGLLPSAHLPLDRESMRGLWQGYFKDEDVVEKFLDIYNEDDFPALPDQKGSSEEAMAKSMTDAVFICTTRRTLRAMRKHGLDTYMYHLNFAAGDGRDIHMSDLAFVFANPLLVRTPDEKELARSFGEFWTNFAHFLNPNGDGEGEELWPAYTTQEARNIILDVPLRYESHYNHELCDMVDDLWQLYN